METDEEQHQHQAQATESTSSHMSTEKREKGKQDVETDSRKEESRAGHSPETRDSSQSKTVSATTAVKESPVQESDNERETEAALAAATVQATSFNSQIQEDSSKRKKDRDTKESPERDYSDDVTEKIKSLQVEDTTRPPESHHPREATEGQEVPRSETAKEDERGAVAEASATAAEEQGEEHGSKKKKKKKKKKTAHKEQAENSPDLGMESSGVQLNTGQKKGAVHSGYILDRHARNGDLSEAAKFLLQSLDEEQTASEPSQKASFRSIVSCVPFEDITRQLFRKVLGRTVTILHGPDGCGKTTAAQMMRNIFLYVGIGIVDWCNHSTFQEKIRLQHEKHIVLIMDNFLGHTSFEGFPKWKPVYDILKQNLMQGMHVLLVTRTSIIWQALASTGADLADLLTSSALVELSVDYQTMYRNMLPKTKYVPDFDAIPDIGFPVCCKLASLIPRKHYRELFENPRSYMHKLVKGLMENTAVLLSLGLLAVTEGYVNVRDLRNPARLNKSVYLEILHSMKAGDINDQIVADILDFYNETPGLVQVEDDFVSFINEAVREEVLCVLCESHAQFLAKHCSLRLLSRLAVVTRDPEQTKDDNEKPILPMSAIEHFLQRLLNEMRLRNYRDTLPSALFKHVLFHRGFKAKVSEASLINTWLGTNDKQGLHFLFWASACKAVTEMLVPLKTQRSPEVILQGVVGSCYWGRTNMLKELLSKLNPDDKMFILTAEIKDLLERVPDSNWKEAPFYPEDTLLTLAAWRGKNDVVEELKAMGAHTDSKGYNNLTPLMHYCARGDVQMVRFLFSVCALPYMKDDMGNTPLHYAVMGGLQPLHDNLFHPRVVQHANHQDVTPLEVACGVGAPRKVLDKLRHGAEPESLNWSLLRACSAGQTKVVQYLFDTEKKRNPILRPEEGFNIVQCMSCAVERSRPEKLVEILLPKIKSRTDSYELRKLCIASCYLKDERAIKEYLPVIKDSLDYECLLLPASIVGNKSVIEYLLETQPSEANKQLVLKVAACTGSWDFMHWALATTKMSVTMDVITWAMQYGESQLAKMLITSGDAESAVDPGFLHLAAQHDLLPVMKWLLHDKHVNVDVLDKDGVRPLSVAIEFGSERAVKCLVNYGARISEDIIEDLHKHKATSLRNDRLCNALEKTVQFLAEEDSK